MSRANPKHAWMNGQIIPWDDAKVHVRAESFMRGRNVFEGIKAYASASKQRLNLFRNQEHMDRLFNSSMKVLQTKIKRTAGKITRGMLETLRANDMREDVPIRPTVYFGIGEIFGFDDDKIEMDAIIIANERPAKSSLWTGISAEISS